MTKTISPEKLRKQNIRREKEIKKWEKEKARPKKNTYFIYLVFIITLIYAVDEIASQIGTQMQADISKDLLATFGEKSNGVFNILQMCAVPFQALGLFYRPLADRFGRKVFLIINTLGMSAAMLIVYLSNSLWIYLIGACMISFFIPHDMHVVFIMESSPSKHRARFYSTIKFVANMGVMLIPIMRKVLMTEVSMWRNVYLVPAIVGLVTSFIALLLARETDAFIDARLKYLKMTDEEREQAKKEKNSQDAQGGLGQALKFAMKHKQLRWLYITTAIVNIGLYGSMNYTPIMEYARATFQYGGSLKGLSEAVLSPLLNDVSVGFVTAGLLLLPLGCSISQLIMGYISDWKGRKTAAIVTAFDCVLGFVIFYFGAMNGWSAPIVGFFCGFFLGSYYSTNDVLIMMIGESSPTNLRSSTMSAQYIVTAAGAAISMLGGMVLALVLGNTAIGTISLCLLVPGFIAGLIILITKTNETKGIDMDTVTGTEWD